MSKASDLEVERRNLLKLTTKATTIVRLLATFISTILATKLFLELVAGFAISPKGAWGFVQITVLIYFWSWFLAAIKGIEIQSLLLNTTATSDQIPLAGYFALFIGFPIGTTAMGLILFSDLAGSWTLKYWSGSLTELLIFIFAVFWIWDMLWQWSVSKTMQSRIARTKTNLEGQTKRYVELEQLAYLESFLFGTWRTLRKILGIAVIVSLIFIVVYLNEFINIPYVEGVISVNSLVAILTFGFVVISEGWIWIMRLRMIEGITALGDIGHEYNLSKKPKTN